MKNLHTENDLLSAILDCGSADPQEVLDWVNQYDIDLHDVIDEAKESENLSVNSILFYTLCEIDRKFKEESDIDEETEPSIFCNYIDTHLSYEDEEIQAKFEAWTESL